MVKRSNSTDIARSHPVSPWTKSDCEGIRNDAACQSWKIRDRRYIAGTFARERARTH